MARKWSVAAAMAGMMVGGLVLAMCTGETPSTPEPAPATPEAPAPAPRAAAPTGPLPTLIMVQAQFLTGPDGRPKPGPARMTLYRTDGTTWHEELIEDPDSNVFHKGMAWRDGILTIGAMKAMLKHWKRDGDGWKATTLWEKSWGGKFDRLRDVEVGDVDGDGQEEIVLVTHDMGVVAVGDENADGTWTFQEFDQKADTFVHEVEIGDVDGDGKREFYVTPSERNKASGASQPGGVARYDFVDGKYVRTEVVQWTDTHAKEILVTDLDGDGKDELYAAKEGEVKKGENGGKATLVAPARVVRFTPDGRKWTESVAATLTDEKQCRFLLAGDLNGDGKKDIVAAGMETGLWLLDRGADGTFAPALVDAASGGFEHATDVADLDGDGKLEIYSASERVGGLRELARFTWDGAAWRKEKIADIPEKRLTWNLQDAKL